MAAEKVTLESDQDSVGDGGHRQDANRPFAESSNAAHKTGTTRSLLPKLCNLQRLRASSFHTIPCPVGESTRAVTKEALALRDQRVVGHPT